jgi:peptidyl-prolyl cis-trans isomerase A (cyclophilin A)
MIKADILTAFLFGLSCSIYSQSLPDTVQLQEKAPAVFQAEFHTTKGNFTLEVVRDWSPSGADRLWQLFRTGFYDNNGIFRVQPGYVVQFGISDDPKVNAFWDKRPIPDEPAQTMNLRGTISYARDGKNSRTVQLFINLKDNTKLDTVNYNGLRGFTPVGRIVKGMDVVESFYGKYGFEPANHQDSVMVQGNAYWKRKFPDIDYILGARITP